MRVLIETDTRMLCMVPILIGLLLFIDLGQPEAWARSSALGGRGQGSSSRSSEPISAAQQSRLVREAVESWAASRGRVRVLDLRLKGARSFRVPRGSSPLSCSFGARGVRGRRTLAELSYTDPSGRLRRHWVQVELRTLQEVVRARAALRRGKVIGHEDVEVVEVEGSALPHDLVRRLEEVLGMVARRSLPEGASLSHSLLAAPILVRRGDAVVVEARDGGLCIRTTGEALEDGAHGKLLKVRVDSGSKRVLRARVSGPRRVEVMF